MSDNSKNTLSTAFLNLEDDTDFENSNIVLQSVPFDLTTSYQKGTRYGPNAIIEASKYLEIFDVETQTELCSEKGIFTAQPLHFSSSEEMIFGLKKNTSSLLTQGKFVVTLGGEHSISFPCIQAHADHYGKISVLQLDAHADLHPALNGNPLSHGSVISRVKELKNVDNLVAAGIRSMSSIEKKYLHDQTTLYSHEIHSSNSWIDSAIENLSDLVYITLDVDVFDSSLMPSTGTPEPGGLFWHQVFQLLKKLTDVKKVIGFDVVELMPIKGIVSPDFTTAKAIYKLLSYIFRNNNDL